MEDEAKKPTAESWSDLDDMTRRLAAPLEEFVRRERADFLAAFSPLARPAARKDDEIVSAMKALTESLREHTVALGRQAVALDANTAAYKEAWRRYDEIDGEGESWKEA